MEVDYKKKSEQETERWGLALNNNRYWRCLWAVSFILILLTVIGRWSPALFGKDAEQEGVQKGADVLPLSIQKKVIPSVLLMVQVLRYQEPQAGDIISLSRGFASGVMISRDGLLLTCYHVLGDLGEKKILYDLYGYALPAGRQWGQPWKGRVYKFTLKKAWPEYDLALLRVSAIAEKGNAFKAFSPGPAENQQSTALPAVRFNTAYPERLLDTHYLFGYAAARSAGDLPPLAVYQGTVESMKKNMMYSSVPGERGFSGAPVLDKRGRLVGICTSVVVDPESRRRHTRIRPASFIHALLKPFQLRE